MPSPLADRQRALDRLSKSLDVLVIGGGITGAGVALDAATRGYRVGLVEQGDFASGTSSRSTKLIHGGLRYLPQGHLRLVREALRERELLRRLAPHLVQPLPFLVPIYDRMRRPLGIRLPALLRPFTSAGISLGLAGYDLLARSDLPHRRLTPDTAAERAPALRTEGLRAAYLYYDAVTDDVRLTLTVLATAQQHGATALNYVRAVALTPGSVWRVTLLDRLSGKRLDVAVRHVVNAAGVWAEQVGLLAGPAPFRLRQSKGVHLVLDRADLLVETALVIPETDDGRLAFLVPWRGRTLLGTTDEPSEGDPAEPRTEPAEARYLLTHLNRYLREPVRPPAVIGAWAGLRPLISRGEARSADLSRVHEVVEHANGLVSIIGGKLTTYRKMAADVVDVLVRRDGSRAPCQTASLVLAGGEEHEAVRAQVLRTAEEAGLSPGQAGHLYGTHGSGALRLIDLVQEEPGLRRALVPGLPVLAGEVILACREEQAVTLVDWLLLRSRLALVDRDHARGCAADVAALMTRELGWSEEERAGQVKAFEERTATELAFLREL